MAGTVAKTLLLSGTPPGKANVAEIILHDLVEYAGPSQFVCCAVVSPNYHWAPEQAPPGLDVRLLQARNMVAQRGSRSKWSAVRSLWGTFTGLRGEVSRLVPEIVAAARESGVQQVFAVLDNALLFALAHRVAAALDKPLVVLVWDPPNYVLQQAHFDRYSRIWLHGQFKRSLSVARRVAVVSETMQADYAAFTTAPIQLLRHGLAGIADGPSAVETVSAATEWQIGFAGSMYARCAWRAFMRALDHADWTIAGRPVRLKVLSSRLDVSSRRAANIDYLGFRPPEEAQRVLASCHLNYMPQPFQSHLRELCRYSFPTKLTSYLSVGRPVFVHAPRDSALISFVQRSPIGATATSQDPAAIAAALESILGNDQVYSEAAASVRSVAAAHFSERSFHASIDELLPTLG
ncbi:hypothetical protein [Arenimonas sp.]|uniref:hypothetical protein n=1 Tax=Arenimonas sp. TaxID=1872635 RepID=UPI0039E5A63E